MTFETIEPTLSAKLSKKVKYANYFQAKIGFYSFQPNFSVKCFMSETI